MHRCHWHCAPGAGRAAGLVPSRAGRAASAARRGASASGGANLSRLNAFQLVACASTRAHAGATFSYKLDPAQRKQVHLKAHSTQDKLEMFKKVLASEDRKVAGNIFNEILDLGLRPDFTDHVALMVLHARAGDVARTLAVHASLLELGDGRYHPSAATQIVRVYVRAGLVEQAEAFFNELPRHGVQPNQQMFRLLIIGNISKLEKARALYDLMVEQGIHPVPDEHLEGLLRAYTLSDDPSAGPARAENVFAEELKRFGLSPTIKCFNAIMIGYASLGNVVDVRRIMRAAVEQGCAPDVVSYTSLIRAHLYNAQRADTPETRAAEQSSAFGVVAEMRERGVSLSIIPFQLLVGTLCEQGQNERAARLIEAVCADRILSAGLVKNDITLVRRRVEVSQLEHHLQRTKAAPRSVIPQESGGF